MPSVSPGNAQAFVVEASPPPASSAAAFISHVESTLDQVNRVIATIQHDAIGVVQAVDQRIVQGLSFVWQQWNRLRGIDLNPSTPAQTTASQPGNDWGAGRGNSSGSGSGKGTLTTSPNTQTQALNATQPSGRGSGRGSGTTNHTIVSKKGFSKAHPLTSPGSGTGSGPITVYGNVWLDSDYDGSDDNGELGYYGATIDLLELDPNTGQIEGEFTQQTDTSGNYNFTFEGGPTTYNYQIQVVFPSGFFATKPGYSQINARGYSVVFGLAAGGAKQINAGISSMNVNTVQDDANNKKIQDKVTLRDAIQTGNNGPPQASITFYTAPNTALSGTIALQAPLDPISKSYNIIGSGTSTLIVDGNSNAGSIFTVNGGVTSDIFDLTIEGGSANNGGGILNNGVVTLSGVAIQSNHATGSGGGIYNVSGGKLTLTSGNSITDNTAGNAGGGIENYGTITMYGLLIDDNEASKGGGGIQNGIAGSIKAYDNTQITNNSDGLVGGGVSNAGTFFMKNGTISNNRELGVGAGGGACNTSGKMTLSSVVFQNNNASQGGGIYVIGGNLTLKNLTLGASASGNKAASGGGVFVNGGTVNMSQVKISSNSASGAGGLGKLAGGGGVFVGKGVVTLTEVYFGGNKSQTNGGGLFVNAGTVKATGGTFTNNRGLNNSSNGGGIYVNGGKLTMIRGPISASISNNLAAAGGTGNGGGMYINGGNVTLSGVWVEDNLSPNKGGGIYNNAGSLTLKNNVLVENNTAGSQGGGMYLAIGSTTTFPGNGFDCTVSGNTIPGNPPRTQGWGAYQQFLGVNNQAIVNNWQPFITVIDKEDDNGKPAQGP